MANIKISEPIFLKNTRQNLHSCSFFAFQMAKITIKITKNGINKTAENLKSWAMPKNMPAQIRCFRDGLKSHFIKK